MAIQIDEKLLSNEAKYALSNAKSKSQLLRDALEYYVRRGEQQVIQQIVKESDDSKIKDEVEEIKLDVVEIKSVLNNLVNFIKNEDLYIKPKNLELESKVNIEEKNSKTGDEISIEDSNYKENEIISDEVKNKDDSGDRDYEIPECFVDI